VELLFHICDQLLFLGKKFLILLYINVQVVVFLLQALQFILKTFYFVSELLNLLFALFSDWATVDDIIHQFLLFGSGGTIIAIDAKDGKELYEKDLDNGFYSSPVIVGNKIIAITLDGDLLKMAPSEGELKIEGNYPIGEKVVATPAFHQGAIIVRTAANKLVSLEAKP
jgi:outer membrane protein assembly factor BamB